MKKKYFKFLKLFILVILFLFIREIFFSGFNYANFNTNSSSNFNWSEKSISMETDNVNNKPKNEAFKKTPCIIIFKKDTLLKSGGDHNPIIWRVENINMDYGYMPLYRNIEFKSNITCNFTFGISKKQKTKNFSYTLSEINGNIVLSGQSEIIGFSSLKNNKRYVYNYIIELITNENSKLLSGLEEKYGI